MYSFAQRSDTIVIDEPLYAHYLLNSNAGHPGKDEIINNMISDGAKVVNEIILGNYSENVIFMKQMTHHLVNLDESFLNKVINIFLIRDPKQLISSLAQVIKTVTITDTGIKKQYELYKKLISLNLKPVVIDSNDILKNPEAALTKLCSEIEIPFDIKMLNWKAGTKKEDGIWAKYWYENVHKSTGFVKQETSSRELPENLKLLYEECLIYFKLMSDKSLKV